MENSFFDRLLIEAQELATKTNALNNFMRTQKFVDLDRQNKDLLYKQSRLMNEYLQVLGQRIELLGEKWSGTHIADQPLPRAFTNFHRSQCELYQKAIDEWGKGTLFITDNAVDIHGKLIPDCMALNTSANGDISDFWEILRKLKSDSAVLG